MQRMLALSLGFATTTFAGDRSSHHTAHRGLEEAMPFIVVGIGAFIYLTPVLWVLLSGRSRGGAKFGWFLVALFFSWLGLAVFLIATQATSSRNSRS